MSVAILVPVLARPGNVRPLLASIEATTPRPCRVLFVCDPGDAAERAAIAAIGGWMIAPGGSYAAKIHAGVAATDEDLVFLAADDLHFTRGWLDAATAHMTDGIQVVGVNDGIRRRRRLHATHFLMTRGYAEAPTIDGRPGPLSSAYNHNFCDDELIATATHRGVYAYAPDAVVEHRHWMNGRARKDSTYEKGLASFNVDKRVFQRRSALWGSPTIAQ